MSAMALPSVGMFTKIQKENNSDLTENLTTGIGTSLKNGFSSVVGSVTGLAKQQSQSLKGSIEEKIEARRAEKEEIKRDKDQLGFFGSLKKKWGEDSKDKKAQPSLFKKMLMGLLAGFVLMSLPASFWTTIKDTLFNIFNWFMNVDWGAVFVSIKDGIMKVSGWVESLYNFFYGEDGLLKTLGIDPTTFTLLGGALLAFTAMFPKTGFMVIKTAFGILWKVVSFIGGKFLGVVKGLLGLGGPKKPPNWNKMSKEEKGKYKDAMDKKSKGGTDSKKTSKTSKSKVTSTKKSGFKAKPKGGGGGWFKKLMGKFGKAGKFLVKMGKGIIQGLMSMGPHGWAILAGIALGGLVWYFWDDIVKVWDKVAGAISEGFSKVKKMVMGMFSNVQGMVGGWLRGVGAGMIADWIDPSGAEKGEEKTEFTWGGFASNLWNIYTGIWKSIYDFLRIDKIRSVVAKWLRGVGAGLIADWIEPDEKKKTGEEFSFMNIMSSIFNIYTGWYGTIMRLIGIDVDGIRSAIAGFLRGIGAGIIADWIEPDAEKKENAKEVTFVNIAQELALTISTLWEKLKAFVMNIDVAAIANSIKDSFLNAGKNLLGMGDDTPEQIKEEEQKKFDKSVYDKELLGKSIIDKEKLLGGMNNGKTTRKLLETIIKDDDLTKEDMDFVKDLLTNDKFKETAVKIPIVTPTTKKPKTDNGQYAEGNLSESESMELDNLSIQDMTTGLTDEDHQRRLVLLRKNQYGDAKGRITPMIDPAKKTSTMNTLQTENAQGKMNGNAPTIVSAPQSSSTTVNNQSSTALVMPPTAKDPTNYYE